MSYRTTTGPYKEFKPLIGWHNFKTGEMDYRSEGPETEEEWRDYIPQIPATQGLFTVHMKQGDTPTEAATKVLEACAGVTRKRE